MKTTTISLHPNDFAETEWRLASSGPLSATTSRFASGVCAVRLVNEQGELVILPFQGQQLWSATLGGRVLTMRSVVAEPKPTQDFLATFGGFLQHCGLLGVGGPSPADTHALHGELPNAPFQAAAIVCGENERGSYIGVSGSYQHTVAFAHNYRFHAAVRLYAGSTLFDVSISVENCKRTPMEFLYLAHINFRPVDNGRLVYSALRTPAHVRVNTAIPSHIQPRPGYAEFLAQLKQNPSPHEVLTPGLAFDPEVVFFIDALADADGWAHTMQVHPDGSADYVRHRPSQLPKVTRWISRTPDQDAIAPAEIGTAEPQGYLAEKAKGNVRQLAPGEQFHAQFDIGVLAPAAAAQLEDHIWSTIHRSMTSQT